MFKETDDLRNLMQFPNYLAIVEPNFSGMKTFPDKSFSIKMAKCASKLFIKGKPPLV